FAHARDVRGDVVRAALERFAAGQAANWRGKGRQVYRLRPDDQMFGKVELAACLKDAKWVAAANRDRAERKAPALAAQCARQPGALPVARHEIDDAARGVVGQVGMVAHFQPQLWEAAGIAQY